MGCTASKSREEPSHIQAAPAAPARAPSAVSHPGVGTRREGGSKASVKEYSDLASIEAALQPQPSLALTPVRLLRGSFLLKRAAQVKKCISDEERQALALQRRQWLEEHEPDAFLTAEQVLSLKTETQEDTSPESTFLKLIALSYCWLTLGHPDPLGQQLVEFAEAVIRERDPHTCQSLAGAGRGVFPDGEFAVFWDWGCLFQVGPSGERTPDEQRAFKHSLATVNLWYAHKKTTVYCMRRLPAGWTSFERAIALLVKGGNFCTWQKVVDLQPRGQKQPIRNYMPAPVEPAEFANLLKSKKFAEGADLQMVADMYTRTLPIALSEQDKVIQKEAGWLDDDAIRFAKVMKLCTSATFLDLNWCEFGREGMRAMVAAFSDGAMPNLATITFGRTPLQDEAVVELAQIKVPGLPQLQVLDLWNCGVRDEGAIALAEALRRGCFQSLKRVEFFNAYESWSEWDLKNAISERGREALRNACAHRPEITINYDEIVWHE